MSHETSRGWQLCQRKGEKSWVLKYRVGPCDWRQHRVPAEYHLKRDAERYAAAWVDEQRRLALEPLPPSAPALSAPPAAVKAPTLRDFAEKWIALRRATPNLARSTVDDNATHVERHILPVLGDIPIPELGSGTLRRFVRDIRAQRAAFTTRNVVNTLTAFFEDAIAEEWITLVANPMRHPGVRKEVPAGVRRAGKNLIIHLTQEQVTTLLALDTLPTDRRTRYVLALTSGMRDGEIAALQVEDLALDAPIPTVSITKSFAFKGPAGRQTMSSTKTDDSVRTLPLHPRAVLALRSWLETGWSILVGRRPRANDPVFPNEEGNHYRPTSARTLRSDLAAAGLPTTYEGHPIDFHATRRSFVTWLNASGVEEGTIKRLIGHAGASVMQRHYRASLLGVLHEAIKKIALAAPVSVPPHGE